jgi:hypothetical protein
MCGIIAGKEASIIHPYTQEAGVYMSRNMCIKTSVSLSNFISRKRSDTKASIRDRKTASIRTVL